MKNLTGTAILITGCKRPPWGLKPKVVYWVYTSEVRPISTYAALLWWKKVILMLPPLGYYIVEKATQATDSLNCSGEFTRARFGHSEVFDKMTTVWPSLLGAIVLDARSLRHEGQ
jgi:hypothetical protein